MQMYDAKITKASSLRQIEKEIRSIGVSEECVRIMRDKALFFLIRLKGVRNAPANILKQEMLACGADATVSQWTVDCSRPRTDVLLMGTLKQLKHVAVKMRMQGHSLEAGKKKEYAALSEEISAALKAAVE